MRVWLGAAVLIAGVLTASGRGSADMINMEGIEPWETCAECHGLDGAGNRIKFPRITGQKLSYIAKQIVDFREGRRKNDGGQMQKTATEIKESDIERVAKWFAEQTAPWPKPTLEAEPDLARARTLSLSGADGNKACLSCHSAAALGIIDKPIVAPRIAGQYDYYIAKQLKDYRDGRRSDNDPEQMMTEIARRLSDADITALAMYLSQNPALHEEVVP